MKYAVIYQSKTGNTKKIAEAIYNAIDSTEKEMCDIDATLDLPEADFYFIGFGIHNNTCGIDISVLMEEHQFDRYALFITCGLYPTDTYREKLLRNIDVWLPDNGELVDTYICQGRTEKHIQGSMISKMPHYEERFREMFQIGQSHPDEEDIDNARLFAANIVSEYR